ncbi:hypothetical protein FJY71_05680, partial [candidate division WOR-3 bacterium]|nr:hypothetical protein [candidate division WOR-3 bacterium]
MSGLVLLVLSALELHRLGPARPFVPEPYTGASVVRFAAGDSILLTHDNPHLTPDISSFRYVLVHLARPASQADLAALRRDGLEPVGYFAYQNVICRRTTDGQGPATNVGAVLPLLPEYRLAPEFRQSRSAARSPVVLSLWPGEDARAAAAGLAALGADVIDVTPRTISAVADPLEAASLDAVAWVQAPGRCEPFNVDVQWVMQTGWWPEVPDPVRGRRVWQHGVRGQGMLIGLFDSGIKTDHQMFRDPALPIAEPGIFPGHRKVAAYKLFRDAVFGDATALTWHGSGVAGTLAGNDAPVPDSSLLD